MYLSERSRKISKLLGSQESRAAYIRAKLGVLVPAQIRALRLNSTNPPMLRQGDLAHEANMHQSRISMFETPGMANMTLDTLAKIGAALRAGVVVKFVPFSEMLDWENRFSPESFDVIRIENDPAFLNPAEESAHGGRLLIASTVPTTNVSTATATFSNEVVERMPVQFQQASSAPVAIGAH